MNRHWAPSFPDVIRRRWSAQPTLRNLAVCFGLLVFVLLLVLPSSETFACPFCGPAVTLGEQIFNVDASALVRRVSGVKGEDGNPGTTTLRVEQVLHLSSALAKQLVAGELVKLGTSGDKPPVVGDEIVIRQYYPPKKGAAYVIRGVDPENFVWGDRLMEISDETLAYVLKSPPMDAPKLERGRFFLQYLETEHAEIASDAFAEFAVMNYEDVHAIREELPREKLRSWIFDEQIPSSRLGLYGLMLGLCGEKTDAALLEKRILQRTGVYRNGIDGVIGGYLVLTGDEGMEFLDREILEKTDSSVREVLAAMQAMRFIWTYGEDCVGKPRLRAGMRELIDRPDVYALAIRDLARWQDWESLDQVVKLYGTKGYDGLTERIATIRYVIACSKSLPKGKQDAPPPHVLAARKHLEALRKKDPKAVKRAEGFFRI